MTVPSSRESAHSGRAPIGEIDDTRRTLEDRAASRLPVSARGEGRARGMVLMGTAYQVRRRGEEGKRRPGMRGDPSTRAGRARDAGPPGRLPASEGPASPGGEGEAGDSGMGPEGGGRMTRPRTRSSATTVRALPHAVGQDDLRLACARRRDQRESVACDERLRNRSVYSPGRAEYRSCRSDRASGPRPVPRSGWRTGRSSVLRVSVTDPGTVIDESV